jgi:P-type E1-E2 ATPase
LLGSQEYAAAGEVAFIMEIGTILEDFTSAKAEKGIESLIRMSPLKARRIIADHEDSENVKVEEIRLGDFIKVLPGEELPIDGLVKEGVSSVDESALTGESMPLKRNR